MNTTTQKSEKEYQEMLERKKKLWSALDYAEKIIAERQRKKEIIYNPEEMIGVKAAFYRAAILEKPIPKEVKEIFDFQASLKGIPADDATGGANLLPVTLSNEIVHEPFVTNPLRNIMQITNIKGLVVPKIAFSIDDDSFIGDNETAQEIEATGSQVTFGRNKFKVKVRVSDTVLHGTDTNLVETVENALKSGLAAKEKKVSFATAEAQTEGEEHMSFYQESGGNTVIKGVEGANMYEAITNAIADLHEDFRENAKVCMKFTDYVSMLKDLANGSNELYGAQPERIIGKPVEFSDSATVPIVGNFSFFQLNYDGIIYDNDKDVNTGEYIWVLTAWFDQWRLLNSAFRLAVVR